MNSGGRDANHRELVPLIRTRRPSTAGSDPNSCSHSVRPSTTTASRPAHLIFFGPERASDGRLDAHHGEQVAAREHAHLQLRRRRWDRSRTRRSPTRSRRGRRSSCCDRGCPRNPGRTTLRELAPSASSVVVEPTVSTSPGRATGSGRSSSASAKLKMAQLAPMPIASDRTATMVKPGCRRACGSRSGGPAGGS